jgi:predicted dehydrogenase
MKKLTCAVLGYGNRGEIYARYAKTVPSELSVIAAIDPSEFRLSMAKADHAIPDDMLFSSLDDFLASGVRCDFVINSTMDQIHYETTVKLLRAGFNLVLEKPITANPEELLHIERLAKEKSLKVVVCHVLRYTPFYSQIKKILDSGELGRVMNMQLSEHVGMAHFIKAYVRGKWRSEAECGSGLLLAKCCHDTDLMCWLNNESEPYLVSSFGERAHFCESNAPDGATQFCYQCPARDGCMFDAVKSEIERESIPD